MTNIKNKLLKRGVINLVLALLFYSSLILFNEKENIIISVFSFLLLVLGMFLSTKGLFLTVKSIRNKSISITVFLASVFLNGIFLVLIILLTLASLKDVIWLFE